MTSEEKLARIMAMGHLRDDLRKQLGTMDFATMIQLFERSTSADLTGGEFELFEQIKAALKARDEKDLERRMALVDNFKKQLVEQFDRLINKLVLELAG